MKVVSLNCFLFSNISSATVLSYMLISVPASGRPATTAEDDEEETNSFQEDRRMI